MTKKKSAEARRPRGGLDRERILDAAQALIAERGLEGWSMRALGALLGVQPMSLYHWFPSRAHVMDALLDRFVERVRVPDKGSWQDRIRGASRSMRAAARAEPAVFPFIAVHRFNTPAALEKLEDLLGVFREPHPDSARRAVAFRLWIHWMVGFCLDETSGFSKGPSAQEPPSDEVVREQFPTVAELGPFNQPRHFDRLFTAGLDAILHAVEGLG